MKIQFSLADQVRVLAKSRLIRLRGTLSNKVIQEINQALSIALDL